MNASDKGGVILLRSYETTRADDHAIARLRKKIEATPHKPRFIHTVHGDGYYLAPDGQGPEA